MLPGEMDDYGDNIRKMLGEALWRKIVIDVPAEPWRDVRGPNQYDGQDYDPDIEQERMRRWLDENNVNVGSANEYDDGYNGIMAGAASTQEKDSFFDGKKTVTYGDTGDVGVEMDYGSNMPPQDHLAQEEPTEDLETAPTENEETPQEDAPAEGAPTEEPPKEETPQQEAPKEEVPQEEVPQEDRPAAAGGDEQTKTTIAEEEAPAENQAPKPDAAPPAEDEQAAAPEPEGGQPAAEGETAAEGDPNQ